VADSRKIDHNYHRVIFQAPIESVLQLSHNAKQVKNFLQNGFRYYSHLYQKIRQLGQTSSPGFEHVYYNGLIGMDSQFLLILSCCHLDDADEDLKIQTIAREVDRLFSLLHLQRSYDSNEFNASIYAINKAVRGCKVGEVRSIFDANLVAMISSARGTAIQDAFSYSLFKDTGIELEKRFKRYFFARIEEFLAQNTKMKMRHSLYDLVSNTGPVNGFHIEHILADNAQSLSIFNGDRDAFDRVRNRLGGLLLLKGRDNISSNNETYADKLRTYANTLYWNETLRHDAYKSKKDFTDMMRKFNLSFRPMDKFDQDEIEERQALLFSIAQIIWH